MMNLFSTSQSFSRREFLQATAALGTAAGVTNMATTTQAAPATGGHVVLLGDSIFDNKPYVGSQPAVIDRLKSELASGWKGTLLAVDGNVTSDIPTQLKKLPAEATHLVISIGGNDALQAQGVLIKQVASVAEGLIALGEARDKFRVSYKKMLDEVLVARKPTVLCTIYDPRFEDKQHQRAAVVGLTAYNDVITRSAFKFGLPLLDLRVLFSEASDYANAIEPSTTGAQKIAREIVRILREHDFAAAKTVVYSGAKA